MLSRINMRQSWRVFASLVCALGLICIFYKWEVFDEPGLRPQVRETVGATAIMTEEIRGMPKVDTPTVVTVFDGPFAEAFANFVAMCASQGLTNVVGMALSKEALDIAQHDVDESGVSASSNVKVLYNQWTADYIKQGQGQERWYRIGRIKTLLTLAGLEANIPIFVIELDVILLRPIFPAFPDSSKYDLLSMYCEPTSPENKINLGFQLYQPTERSKSFIKKVFKLAFEKQKWDQGALNTVYNADKKQLRLHTLEICNYNGKWGNELRMPPFVEKVQHSGSVKSASAEDGHFAIHIIGKKKLDKLEWMQQGCVLDSKPYGAESFIMLDGVFNVGVYEKAVDFIFNAGERLSRTPILPHVGSNKMFYDLVDVEKLRGKNSHGFRNPAFVNGQLYLQRSNIPEVAYYCNVDILTPKANLKLPAGVAILTESESNKPATGCGKPVSIDTVFRLRISTGQGMPVAGGEWPF